MRAVRPPETRGYFNPRWRADRRCRTGCCISQSLADNASKAGVVLFLKTAEPMQAHISSFANRPVRHWLREQLVGIAFCVLTVAVVTALIAAAQLFVRIEHVNIPYLIPVLLAAMR